MIALDMPARACAMHCWYACRYVRIPCVWSLVDQTEPRSMLSAVCFGEMHNLFHLFDPISSTTWLDGTASAFQTRYHGHVGASCSVESMDHLPHLERFGSFGYFPVDTCLWIINTFVDHCSRTTWKLCDSS